MEAVNKLSSLPDRFTIPLNVGMIGGDLPTRYFAATVVLLLTVAAAPPLHLAYSAVKIFSLLTSMSGTILLMAGLVFSQRTHYAGVMLILTSLLMMWLASLSSGPGASTWGAWLAVLIGLIVLGLMAQNLFTKRCGVNKLFGVQSCTR
jgi:hypothetical protein